jgi:hypothetical protein
MNAAGYFKNNPAKHKWMKWGTVNFTEDHGDIEWIIDHPNEPVGVTEYKRRLAAVSQARAAVRNAMTPVGASPYYLSKTPNGADGEVIKLELGADNRASSQITVESNDRAKTKQGLMEGLTHGLDEDTTNPNRHVQLRNADPLIVATVSTSAARLNLPTVDTGLVAAYLIADLCHKAVTLLGSTPDPGNGSLPWDNASSNFKSWRKLFPKSHPSQILLQSMDTLPTAVDIANFGTEFVARKAAIIGDILNLLASKFLQGKVHPLYAAPEWAADPAGANLQTTMLTKTHAGGVAGVQADLVALINANQANFLNVEYDATVNALLDLNTRSVGVVKSSSFAKHTGSSKGFAFEDRAEVNTTFPGLESTYDRIVKLVNRY